MTKISDIAKASKSKSFQDLNPEFFGRKAPGVRINQQAGLKTDPSAIAGHFKTTYDQDKDKGISHTIKEEPSLPRKKRKDNDRLKGKRKDEHLGARYKVSINFYFADKRRRDLDGGTATVLDSIIAVRRQLEDSPGGPLLRSISGKY